MLALPVHAADKKERGKPARFDPKNFLLELVSRADKDRDGSISIQEFEKLPLLREAKQGKIDELFVTIDVDANGGLSTEELAKGLGKISGLVKAEGANVDDARRHAKRIKRALKP